jgi:hypothetical protein
LTTKQLETLRESVEESWNSYWKSRYDTHRLEDAKLIAGPKYTKLDVGTSGKFMIVNATGEIYGIKTYGRIHLGHYYGTLDDYKIVGGYEVLGEKRK